MSQRVTFQQLQQLAAGGDVEAQYCLGGACYQQGRTDEALGWLERAVAAGHAQAAKSLGLLFLDGARVPRDLGRARILLELAAAHGLAEAHYHLAELHGFSAFGEVDAALSYQHLLHSARAGYGPALRVLGFAWAETERWETARCLFAAAGLAGDGPGWHALGLCWLRGLGGESNSAAALAAFQEGEARGELRSRQQGLALAGLSPRPRPVPEPDWAALAGPPPERVLPTPTRLCAAPRIEQIGGLFSELECDYLINLAAPRVQPSMIVHPLTGVPRPDPVRSSRHLTLEPVLHDLVLERLEGRLASCAGLPASHGEFLSLLQYRPGEEYKLHYDYFNTATPGAAVNLAQGGQRVQTLLVYLNDDFGGGATAFPRAGLSITPRRGDLVHFYNTDAAGEGDRLTLHAGEPVLSGEKWLASKWVRAQGYPQRVRWGGPGL